jgi:hypothetical protein
MSIVMILRADSVRKLAIIGFIRYLCPVRAKYHWTEQGPVKQMQCLIISPERAQYKDQ